MRHIKHYYIKIMFHLLPKPENIGKIHFCVRPCIFYNICDITYRPY